MSKISLKTQALNKLIIAGVRMSNVCFNLKQHPGKSLAKRDCDDMRMVQNEWDMALDKFNESRRRAARKAKQ